MEHAAGVPLQSKWPQMKGDRRVSCIDALYRQMNEVVNLPFSRYGSLYLPDAKRATSGPLDVDVYIGPHCGTRYWDCNVNDDRYYHDRPPNRGPCESSRIHLLSAWALNFVRGKYRRIL